MRFPVLVAVMMAGGMLATALPASAGKGYQWKASGSPGSTQRTLRPFRSDDELVAYIRAAQKARRQRPVPPPPAPPAPTAAMESAAPAESKAVAADGAAESITNVQEAGVDEGGIVKVHGDHLVILRRGRLFTVSTRGGDLKPVDQINAFPPDVRGDGAWYDEMLVAGNRVIVIGYSYGRGGTEVNRFRIDDNGRLSFEDAYHLKSNDYYSSRNYASRLIGNRLIIYTPLYLPYNAEDKFDWLPGVRRWQGSASREGFKRLVTARDVFYIDTGRSPDDGDIDALHTVVDCDLAAAELACSARSILGPSGRTFYVSSNAVYVWVSQNRWYTRTEDEKASILYRLPLDGGAPSAVGVRGAPVDQFSFREDAQDGLLNVLVRSDSGGDAMWNPAFSSGRVALLRMPLSRFSDGRREVPDRFYRLLPEAKGDGYEFQNRYVGDYLLYGVGGSWGAPKEGRAVLRAVALKSDNVFDVALTHGVDRIEAMGRDAVVVGSSDSDLTFSSVELGAAGGPRLGDAYTLRGAAQGETRSQGFFFKPDAQSGEAGAGVLGLPVAHAGRPGYKQLAENSASIIFLRRTNRKFMPLGELWSREEGVADDACEASCVDWYGNARPIFLRGRTFALMGYEIVEGEVGLQSLRETRRTSFAPKLPKPAR